MPYVDTKTRQRLADPSALILNAGELNYLITEKCLDYLGDDGTYTYEDYNFVGGVLARLETDPREYPDDPPLSKNIAGLLARYRVDQMKAIGPASEEKDAIEQRIHQFREMKPDEQDATKEALEEDIKAYEAKVTDVMVTVMNGGLGALRYASYEFYRRAVAPYEDDKIAKNGDVY